MEVSKENFWMATVKTDMKAYLIKKALEKYPNVLDERYTKVLEMRFGLLDGKEHTLEQVGQIFKVTSERIRQIENKALRKLRLL